MRRPNRFCALPASVLIALVPALSGLPAGGGVSAMASCAKGLPANAVCDRALGVAVVLLPGWSVAPPTPAEPEGLTLVARGVARLSIFPLATVPRAYDICATDSAAAILAHAAAGGGPIQQTPIRVGYEPAILLSGFRGVAGHEIVVTHDGGVMRLLLYGPSMNTEIGAVLRSMRFIPRFRPFPQPREAPPVALGAALDACAGGPPRLVFTGITPLAPLTVNVVGTGLPAHQTLTVELNWRGTPRPHTPRPRYTRYTSFESPRTDARGLLFAALSVPVNESRFFPFTIVVTAKDPATGRALARVGERFDVGQ